MIKNIFEQGYTKLAEEGFFLQDELLKPHLIEYLNLKDIPYDKYPLEDVLMMLDIEVADEAYQFAIVKEAFRIFNDIVALSNDIELEVDRINGLV